MPIPVPFPAVAPTVYAHGTLPVLTVSRGTTSLPFSPPNWVILPGVEGLDDPPRALIDVEPATWDGSLPIAARYTTREVFQPLHYAAGSTVALRTALRDLAALTDVKRGPVTLEVAHADGTRRWIDGFLAAPFATALTQGEARLWRQVGLTLRCGDPFWSGVQRSLTFQLGGTIPEFLSDTFLPLAVSDSQVLGAITVDNPGDADAWPTWTLTGPFDDAVVTTSDAQWTVPDGLADGETLVVDTGRGVQTVTVDDVPAWGRLGPGAQFAALAPGDNAVTLTLTGATEATRLTVAWRERWLTAW